jgi:hypothetical protein
MRIAEHPIIASYAKREPVTFFFEGRQVQGLEGEPIAVALRALGIQTHRYTVKRHEPRGIFCAIGRCTDCVMVVDGKPNVRTCVTPLASGMQVRVQDGLVAKSGGENRDATGLGAVGELDARDSSLEGGLNGQAAAKGGPSHEAL